MSSVENEWLNRTEILIGKDCLEKLQNAKVTVIGLGGVGSYTCESLARAGIFHFQIIDFDAISITNINRQIVALNSTLRMFKTIVMKQRILDINPKASVETITEFISEENRNKVLKNSDYIVDAIDSLGPKMGLLKDLCGMDIPFISVLGAGNRLNPELIKITSIWKTENCPMAKRLRKLLRRYGVTKSFPVVFSVEKPIKPIQDDIEIPEQQVMVFDHESIPKTPVGSISYLPAIMGMFAASKVIRDLIGK